MEKEAGYKVTLKDVHAELINLRDVELKQIWNSQNDICRKLDKYNGLHEKVDKLKKEVYEDRNTIKNMAQMMQTTKTKEETEAEVMKRISEAEELTRRVEHDKFMRILKIFVAVVAVAGLIAGYLW